MKWILPVLANLSKPFQKGTFNYASIKPSIDYSKGKLNDVKITEARLCLLGISMGSNTENALSTGSGDLNFVSMFLTRALRYFWRKSLLIFGFTSEHTGKGLKTTRFYLTISLMTARQRNLQRNGRS